MYETAKLERHFGSKAGFIVDVTQLSCVSCHVAMTTQIYQIRATASSQFFKEKLNLLTLYYLAFCYTFKLKFSFF